MICNFFPLQVCKAPADRWTGIVDKLLSTSEMLSAQATSHVIDSAPVNLGINPEAHIGILPSVIIRKASVRAFVISIHHKAHFFSKGNFPFRSNLFLSVLLRMFAVTLFSL